MPQLGRVSRLRKIATRLAAWTKRFARAEQGATAVVFGLVCVVVILAGGVGLDMARAMVLKSRMAEALDAAGLAVGASNGLTTAQMTTLAQQYFNANYPTNALGTPGNVSLSVGGTNGSIISLSVTGTVPTTLMQLANINSLSVTVNNQVSKSLTKLWVTLVLDNTGSMSETDGTGTSKISALKTATSQLLTTLQNAATNPGDVQVAIIPFSKDVNVGTGYVNASWIDWTDWAAPPANGAPSSSVGPGSSCPYSTSSKGYRCQSTPTNGSSTVSNIPSSGTYKGYICPGVDSGSVNTGRKGRYYNGCYNSVGASAPYTHTWIVNNHSTWGGCIMDRTQNYDVDNTTPSGSSTNFPAENAQSCVPSVLGTLSYDWTALQNQAAAMSAGGSTNQTIGLVWGWQAFTSGNPLNAGALPANTTEVIILLSDGLNTQDRWYGDGSNQSTSVDDRMTTACGNARTAGIQIYTVFVDLNGTTGNSTVLQNCATDINHYFDLTTSGEIVTTFNQIGQTLANLHIAQ